MINFGRFLLFVFWLISINSFAQKSNLDILKDSLETKVSPQTKSQLLTKIGIEYFHKQIYLDSAYYFTNKAYTIAQENNLLIEEARALSIKANINVYLGQNKIALEELKSAAKIYSSIGETDYLFGCYNNIGGTYFHLKQYDVAITYYNKALAIANEKNKNISMAIAKMNIAEALYVKNDFELAKSKFEESLLLIKESKFNPPTIHLFYARTLYALKEFALAEKEGIEAFRISTENQDLKYASESAQFLSELYQDQTKFEKALVFKKQQINYKEKIHKSKEKNEIEKLKLNFELQEKNRQLAFAAKKEKYMTLIWFLAAAGVLFLGLLIYRQLKITKMTRSIHDVQKRLVETELIIREKKLNKISMFKAVKEQDKELL